MLGLGSVQCIRIKSVSRAVKSAEATRMARVVKCRRTDTLETRGSYEEVYRLRRYPHGERDETGPVAALFLQSTQCEQSTSAAACPAQFTPSLQVERVPRGLMRCIHAELAPSNTNRENSAEVHPDSSHEGCSLQHQWLKTKREATRQKTFRKLGKGACRKVCKFEVVEGSDAPLR